MQHQNLTLEYDKNLINNVLDNSDLRYVILFMYIIRNDLFKDLSDQNLIESYERVLILDEIYKNNIINFWNKEFIEIYIDLGLMKNVRSIREFEQKEDDFIIKLGDETITIEKDMISVPDDILYLIINKKFKFLTRRNFNLALTRLKGVRCEKSNVIHSFIFEIGEHDYALSDDLYNILDQYGNIYQTIKIEITIEGFNQRLKEILEKINEFVEIYEPILNSKSILDKINNIIEKNEDIIKSLKEDKVKLNDKFDFSKVDRDNDIFQQWSLKLLVLLKLRYDLIQIEKNLKVLTQLYSGKERKHSYLDFIEKVSFNEDNIIEQIQKTLFKLREELVQINNKISKLTKKELKILNLDYERLIITSSED